MNNESMRQLYEEKLYGGHKIDEKFLDALNEDDLTCSTPEELYNKCKNSIYYFFNTIPCELKQGGRDIKLFNMNKFNYCQINNLMNKKSVIYDVPPYCHNNSLQIAFIAYNVIFNNYTGDDFIILCDNYNDNQINEFIKVYNRLCETFGIIPDKKYHPKYYNVKDMPVERITNLCRGCCKPYVFVNVTDEKYKCILGHLYPIIEHALKNNLYTFSIRYTDYIGKLSEILPVMKFDYLSMYTTEQLININSHLEMIARIGKPIIKRYKYSNELKWLLLQNYTIDSNSLSNARNNLIGKNITMTLDNDEIVIGKVIRMTDKAIHIVNQNYDNDENYLNLIKDKIAILYCKYEVDNENNEIIIDEITSVKLEIEGGK